MYQFMTTYIGTGFSSHKDPLLAGKIAATSAQKQIRQQKADIVLVFSSIHYKDKRLLEGISSVFGKDVNILGCSGFAVIDGSDIYRYGVVVMAIHSLKIKFGIGRVDQINKDNPRESGEQFAHAALKNLSAKTREIGIIFSDGLVEKGSELLSGIKDTWGKSFPIIGASAADNFTFTKTYQYFNREVLNNALIGTILSGEGVYGYGLRHGWHPLGRPHTVTHSTGNIVRRIENKPAINIYTDYFKKTAQEIKSMLTQIGILYPLGIYVPGEEEYLLRNPIRVDNEGGLVCQGDVPEASQIRLMMGTKDSALQAAKQAAWEAKNAIKNNTLLGAIIFESVSRMKLLGYRIKEEISIIKNILGENTHCIGVCTFGEQAPLKSLEYHGESHFHNETVAVLTIGEHRAFAE